MFKSIRISIDAPLTHLFTCPCSKDVYQPTGKLFLLFPSLSVHLTWTTPKITDPFSYSLSLASYLNVYSLLYKFCHGHNHISTTSSALLLANHCSHPLIQSTKSAGVCFLYLKKAFDSVPHKPLIDLLSSLHFTHYFIRLHSYLSARSQEIVTQASARHPYL